MASNYLKKEKFYWLKFLFDGILLFCSFLLIYYLKRDHLVIDYNFVKFLLLLFLCWFFVTLFSKKFMKVEFENYFLQIKPFIFSIVAIVCLISLFIYILGWYFLSRFIVYGTIGVFLIMESIYLFFRIHFLKRRGFVRKIHFSIVFFFVELLVILIIFMSLYSIRKGTLKLSENYLVLLMGIFFVWLLISFILHEFTIKREENYIKTIFRFWKSEIIIFGLVSTFIFILKLVEFSRFIILGSLLIFSLVENLIVTLYFIYNRKKETDEVDIKLFRAIPIEYQQIEIKEKISEVKKKKYSVPGFRLRSILLSKKLKNVYLGKFKSVYDFVEKNVDLGKTDILKSVVLFTRSPYNFEILEDDSIQFFLNLREVNDFRRINRIFIEINKKLKPGGIFIGRFLSLKQSKAKYYLKFPFIIAKISLFFSFIYKRMIPKFPFFKKIYFAFSKGRRRFISEAEALGRLYFCGFEIIDLTEIDHFTWFITKKVKQPLSDKNPSYGMLFKQKRIGKEGKFIYMYKMRTMHPYSEYIHHYVYEKQKLDETGKIKDDFRITGWGRIFRKLLIDEIPMLINWLKGQVKLVGVRPLSESFFNTYPEDLKEERIKFKPGLIPPFYVEMPENIEEVWESERKYLEKYKKHPLRTNFVYFFKALNNILFHHARSG